MPDHVSGPETPGFSPGSGFIKVKQSSTKRLRVSTIQVKHHLWEEGNVGKGSVREFGNNLSDNVKW